MLGLGSAIAWLNPCAQSAGPEQVVPKWCCVCCFLSCANGLKNVARGHIRSCALVYRADALVLVLLGSGAEPQKKIVLSCFTHRTGLKPTSIDSASSAASFGRVSERCVASASRTGGGKFWSVGGVHHGPTENPQSASQNFTTPFQKAPKKCGASSAPGMSQALAEP